MSWFKNNQQYAFSRHQYCSNMNWDNEMCVQKFEVPEKMSLDTTFKSILDNENYADVFLQVGKNKLKVHSFYLAEQSSVFADLIRTKKDDIVEITDLTFEQLKDLVTFLYEDSIENVSERAEELLLAARKYKLDRLTKICENALYEKLDMENALRILKISADGDYRETDDSLFKETVKFVHRNIEDIVAHAEWDLFVQENPSLFFAIFTKWVRYRGYSISYEYGSCYNNGASFLHLDQNLEQHLYLQMTSDFSDLFEKQLFTDVTFKFGNRELKAHKGILSCRSKVFAGMFAHNFQESLTNNVIINDIKFEVFQELLRFVYSGKVRDMERVGFELLQAAEMYDLKILKKICIEFIKTQISTENFSEILDNIPDLYKNEEFVTAISGFFGRNIDVLLTDKYDDMEKFALKNPAFLNELFLQWIDRF